MIVEKNMDKQREEDLASIRETVSAEYCKGNVVLATFEGLVMRSLASLIAQPVDGLLYDLNRSEVVALTHIEDPKWVNDYAVAKVIRALKARIDELESLSSHP